MQTQQNGKLSVVEITSSIVKEQGFLALYTGLSASLLRQLTYSMTRFGAYEVNFIIIHVYFLKAVSGVFHLVHAKETHRVTFIVHTLRFFLSRLSFPFF